MKINWFISFISPVVKNYIQKEFRNDRSDACADN